MTYLQNITPGDIIEYSPKEDLTIKACVLSIVDTTYYIYAQNRIVALSTTDSIITDSNIICDYCVIPEIDEALREIGL